MPNNSIVKLKDGDSIKGFYFCKNIQNKITRLGDEYLDLILEDSTGNIRAKVWSYVDHYKDDIRNGSKVAVKGKIITYNNELEIDILHINSIENGLYEKYGYSDDLIFKHSENELKNLTSVEQVFPSQTNFVLVRTTDSEQFCERAKKLGFLLRNVDYQPTLNNCVRITVGTREQNKSLIRGLRDE